jgi:transcription-repair coupling factor (superfamily II helicase)
MEMREAFAASSDRLAALTQLRARRGFTGESWKDVLVVVTTPLAILQPVPALEAVREREIKLAAGTTHPFQELVNALRDLDYDHEPVCEQPKQYAVRGGIIDVWPVTAALPVRLDFFGDTIEEIREFDPVTQRSGEKVDSIVVSASPSLALPQAPTGIGEYLGPRTHWVLVDPPDLETAYLADRDVDTLPASLAEGLAGILSGRAESGDWVAGLFDIELESVLFPTEGESDAWETDALANHRSHPDPHLIAQDRLDAEQEARKRFLRQVADWQEDGWRVHFVLSREGGEQRAKEILTEDGIGDLRATWHRGALDAGCRIGAGSGIAWKGMPRGAPGVVVVTETELFGRARVGRASKRRRTHLQASQVDHMLDFAELVEGDHVVHILHGIGIFRGLTRIEVAGEQREVLSVEFDNSVTLHVPLQESHVLSRYVGLTKTKPSLGRIGTNRWEKTRAAAERATLDVAAQLLEVQARRDTQPGFACPPDNAWQHEFEGAFPFEETPDQQKAIDATKLDLEKTRPMDRLICGDVGFGKTEVAIRAAF